MVTYHKPGVILEWLGNEEKAQRAYEEAKKLGHK
jgi:hypothetical protein